MQTRRLRSALWCALPLLLTFAACGDDRATDDHNHNDHDHDPVGVGHCGHLDGDGFVLETADGAVPLRFWRDEQTGSLAARVGEPTEAMRVVFLDADSVQFTVSDTCPENSLEWTAEPAGRMEILRETGVEWTFRVVGLEPGEATLRLRMLHEDHAHLASHPIPVTILPAAGTGAITGAISLRVVLADESGTSTGEQLIGEATGVRVYLGRPDGTRDSTLTRDGQYRFAVETAGDYRVLAGAHAELLEQTGSIPYAGGELEAPELTLGPSGVLETYPNPFPYAHGVGIEFSPASAERVEIEVRTLSGETIWSFAYDAPAGFQHIHWIGTDQSGAAMPPGAYWVVVGYDGHRHAQLVVKAAE